MRAYETGGGSLVTGARHLVIAEPTASRLERWPALPDQAAGLPGYPQRP